MDTPASQLESLIERAETYGKTTLELTRLRAMAAAIRVLTTLIARGSVILLFAFFALMSTVGVALWLGEWFGKASLGFFAVGAFYLLAALVAHSFLHGWLQKPISDLVQGNTQRVDNQ